MRFTAIAVCLNFCLVQGSSYLIHRTLGPLNGTELPEHTTLLDQSVDIVSAVLIAPVLETFVMHFVGYTVASKFWPSITQPGRVVLMALALACMHAGIATQVAVFFGFLVLAYTYVFFHRQSMRRAVVVTSIVHALHNGLVIAMRWIV